MSTEKEERPNKKRRTNNETQIHINLAEQSEDDEEPELHIMNTAQIIQETHIIYKQNGEKKYADTDPHIDYTCKKTHES